MSYCLQQEHTGELSGRGVSTSRHSASRLMKRVTNPFNVESAPLDILEFVGEIEYDASTNEIGW